MSNTETWQCTSCDNKLDGSAKFCSNCGTVRPAPKCSNCETELDPQWKFCEKCGTPTTSALPDEPTPAPPDEPTPAPTLQKTTPITCPKCKHEQNSSRITCSLCGEYLRRTRAPRTSGQLPSSRFLASAPTERVPFQNADSQPATPTPVVTEGHIFGWWLRAWKNWSGSGRSPRSEFWWFQVVNIALLIGMIWMAGAFTDMATNTRDYENTSNGWALIISGFYLAWIIPSITVTVRRLHDTNRSGSNIFWHLFPLVGQIILFVYLVDETRLGPNRYE